MRDAFLLSVALLAAPAVAQQKPTSPPSGGPDIVVTGMSLKDAQAALATCIERRCPPDQDIAATLAVAETQFVAGDYRDARTTMRASLGRNKRFAKDYPVPVSDLLRANSRVAAHLGQQTEYFSGVLDMVGALKAGLSDSDARVLAAQIELGDAFAKTGRFDSAIDAYRKVARRAHALDLPRVEGSALLHVASLYAAGAEVSKGTYHQAAVSATDVLIANRDPRMALYGEAAAVLRAKLAVRNGDPAAIDRLVATYRSGAKAASPVLLYAPPIAQQQTSGREYRSGTTLNKVAMDDFDDQWVDVSFFVGADGKVSDAEVLRRSPKLSGDYWIKPILAAVSGRRYAPLAPDAAGFLRIERYTFTSAWTTLTGTHMRVRSPVPQIESVDLSRDPPSG